MVYIDRLVFQKRKRMKKQIISSIFAILIGLSLTQTAFADTVYIVQQGDTLTKIAQQYSGVSWLDIARTNDILNPNIIYVGQVLRIPEDANGSTAAPTSTPTTSTSTSTTESSYTVKAGDNLYRIGLRFNTDVETLAQLNNINDRGVVLIGQVLKLPSGSVEVIPAATVAVVAKATATPIQVAAAPTAPPPTATPAPVQPTNTPAPAPPTAPPVPVQPTATPVPQVVTGGNLLRNGSFEHGHYNMNGVQELQLPSEWAFEWDVGPTGFGGEEWDKWVRPETRVLGRPFIPPHEHHLFIYDGDVAVKIFKGYGAISVRLFQDVDLQPGNYRLTVRAFSDMVTGYQGGKKYATDPVSAEVNVFAGNNGTGFIQMPIGQKGTATLNFTINSPQKVRVGAALRGRFALESNGYFIDHWELVRTN